MAKPATPFARLGGRWLATPAATLSPMLFAALIPPSGPRPCPGRRLLREVPRLARLGGTQGVIEARWKLNDRPRRDSAIELRRNAMRDDAQCCTPKLIANSNWYIPDR